MKELIDIIVDPNVRRRRGRRPLSGKKKAAALFRVWHGVCDMIEEAARHVVLGQALQLRVGVHTGPAVGGVIGSRKLAFDLWGDTVNVASRLQAQAVPGRVNVSEATWLLVNDRFEGDAQGTRELRGLASMRTYAITGPALAPSGETIQARR